MNEPTDSPGAPDTPGEAQPRLSAAPGGARIEQLERELASLRRDLGHSEQGRKQAEEALREADERKNEFLATLAHELRNPLAPIRTGVQLLNLLANDSPDAAATRAMIERQLIHMVRLVDDLLDVSRLTRGKVELLPERVELRRVIESAVEANRPLFDAAQHSLTVRLPTPTLWLKADVTRLAQVVGNLLNNAAKFTPEGGQIELAAYQEGGQVIIRVTDNGLGIAPELLPNLFAMFAQSRRTLNRAQGGLGIGLSLVRQLIELHGGTVSVTSAGVGCGSTFTLRLPSGEAVPEVSARLPAALPQPTPSAKLRVMIVDDNIDAAEILAMLLQRSGHSLRTAHSGAKALDIAREFRPDVIFLDIGMPEMDGYEVATRLRHDLGLTETMVVALTGWGSPEDKRKTQAAGFDEHLTKPVDAAAVRRLLAQASQARQAVGPS